MLKIKRKTSEQKKKMLRFFFRLQVGLYMVVFCCSSALSSVITGWVSGSYGRNLPLLIAFIIDLTQLIFLLLWKPSHDNTWLVFIIAIVYGYVDGTLQLIAQGEHT